MKEMEVTGDFVQLRECGTYYQMHTYSRQTFYNILLRI